ncbi:FecR family protein [Filimonas effusa]|uniref:FecR family protein n=1 Tax=Filimonas effusa TaxID=2508721 RepID=A0A4Q1DCY2_9BACT|nr:FecR family protein [Filimonas effusa]RXK86503.1 FecR family protein [Filimonas effusa]
MDKRVFISLIDKYLSGQATAEEEEMMVKYYQSFQNTSAWDHETLGDAGLMQGRLQQRLNATLREHEAQPEQTPVIPVKRKTSRTWWIAASLVALVFLCGYFLQDRLMNVLDPVKMVQVNTAKGTRKKLQLPDGSVIWLEGGSSFSYPEVFRGKERTVYLSGEAFFEVTGNPANPFIIHTPLVETKVLGTSFNIEAYGEKQVEVVVVSGKVSLNAEESDAGKPLILHPNEKALYDSSNGVFNVKKAPEAKDYELRKNGQFVYKGAAVADIIKDLERAYNTPIAIKRDLLNCTFYGDFNALNNVEKALNLIALTLNARVEKLPGTRGYAISGGSCQ